MEKREEAKLHTCPSPIRMSNLKIWVMQAPVDAQLNRLLPLPPALKQLSLLTHGLLESTRLNQELNAGQHMTIADCPVGHSKIRKRRIKYSNKF